MLNPYAIFGAVGAIIIAFASGSYTGYKYEHGKFENYKLQVAIVVDKKEAENVSVKKQQALVNKGITNEYEAKISAIRNYYSYRMRNSNSSGGILPFISDPSSGVNESASDQLLIGQCAETTQQLMSLQGWINLQTGIQ